VGTLGRWSFDELQHAFAAVICVHDIGNHRYLAFVNYCKYASFAPDASLILISQSRTYQASIPRPWRQE